MKKLRRSDAGIDYVRLLADHSEKLGVSEYDSRAIQEFGDELQRSLTSTARSESRLRGLRVEALFRTMVAAIGDVLLIKTEDSGELYYLGEDLSVPDYRVVTASGDHLLVEVKAVRGKPFSGSLSLSHAYIERIQRYAAMMGSQLRFAIFWEGTGWWTLNRLESFAPGQAHERQWRITFAKAFATNEMIELGDYSVSTWAPLRFRALFDTQKSDTMRPGETGSFRLTTNGFRLFSQDRELSGIDARVAWKLLWYGRWEEGEQEPHFEGNHLAWVDHPIVPPGWGEPECPRDGPSPVGFLSEMISAAYLQGAAHTIHTTAKGGVLQPGYMADFIPPDWFDAPRQLPLVVAKIQPNFSFEEGGNESPGSSAADDG